MLDRRQIDEVIGSENWNLEIIRRIDIHDAREIFRFEPEPSCWFDASAR